MVNIEKIKNIMQERLSPTRYAHSRNVAEEAKNLAKNYGENMDKAYLAGMLHDYAKGLAAQKLITIAEKHDLIEDKIEYLIPDILHARVGARLLREDKITSDSLILTAIARHTLGDANMSDFDKIIFLADLIEPSRDYPLRERLHCIAYKQLDDAMLVGLELTIKHCLDNKRLLHPKTIQVRNIFLEKQY
ncbi:MAG: HD domain-containing protein [Syntrophomonadaceae bacterium]|nr:HD domain-containing protein [Syntrophomonadaceae bacterium]